MAQRRPIIAKLVRLSVIALAVYACSYLGFRAAKVMVRVGMYRNVYTTAGVHAPSAGWNDLRVSVRSNFMRAAPLTKRHFLERLYAPLIYLECQHHYEFGYEPKWGARAACCDRKRMLGFAAMGGYAVSALGAGWFAWRFTRRLDRHAAHCCSGCGYDLKGLPARSRCPECGQAKSA